MPKRLMIVLAVAALAIAACHSSSTTTPTPTGTFPSPSPNPSIKKATILVTRLGTPAPNVPVQESTPKSTSSPRPGTPFETLHTNKKGTAVFKQLDPDQVYCWVAILAPHQTSSECASWAIWQTNPITLGT
jgi:hypothetical protein